MKTGIPSRAFWPIFGIVVMSLAVFLGPAFLIRGQHGELGWWWPLGWLLLFALGLAWMGISSIVSKRLFDGKGFDKVFGEWLGQRRLNGWIVFLVLALVLIAFAFIGAKQGWSLPEGSYD